MHASGFSYWCAINPFRASSHRNWILNTYSLIDHLLNLENQQNSMYVSVQRFYFCAMITIKILRNLPFGMYNYVVPPGFFSLEHIIMKSTLKRIRKVFKRSKSNRNPFNGQAKPSNGYSIYPRKKAIPPQMPNRQLLLRQ